MLCLGNTTMTGAIVASARAISCSTTSRLYDLTPVRSAKSPGAGSRLCLSSLPHPGGLCRDAKACWQSSFATAAGGSGRRTLCKHRLEQPVARQRGEPTLIHHPSLTSLPGAVDERRAACNTRLAWPSANNDQRTRGCNHGAAAMLRWLERLSRCSFFFLGPAETRR